MLAWPLISLPENARDRAPDPQLQLAIETKFLKRNEDQTIKI